MASESLLTTDPLLWLRLALAEKVGLGLVHRLLEEFGSAHAIFDATSEELGRAFTAKSLKYFRHVGRTDFDVIVVGRALGRLMYNQINNLVFIHAAPTLSIG